MSESEEYEYYAYSSDEDNDGGGDDDGGYPIEEDQDDGDDGGAGAAGVASASSNRMEWETSDNPNAAPMNYAQSEFKKRIILRLFVFVRSSSLLLFFEPLLQYSNPPLAFAGCGVWCHRERRYRVLSPFICFPPLTK